MPTASKQSPRPTPAPALTSTSRANGPVDADDAWGASAHVRMLLYGRSGTGKTTFWATFPGPILALVCSGSNRPGELRSIDTPAYRKKVRPVVVRSTTTFRDHLAAAGDYATVVLDHASGLQDLTLKEILGLDELPAQKKWGLATQQQYGQSSLMCKEMFRALLGLSGNVVVVAQERTFGGDDGPSDVIAPVVGAALTPSVTGWLAPACDYVVQTYLRPRVEQIVNDIAGQQVITEQRGKGVEYCLRTAPHDVFMSKFRMPRRPATAELPECIVDPSYDKVVKLIRGG